MKKKIIGFMLAICAIISLTLCAHASEIIDSGKCGAQDDNVTWTLDSEGTLTISGEGEMADYNEDSYSEYYASPFGAYSNINSNIKSVVIEDGVTSIGSWTFDECAALKNISIGSDVETINSHAFYGCNGLESVTIPDNVTNIGSGIFWNCEGLQNVQIGKGINNISVAMFKECTSLKSIIIPSNITYIQVEAFAYCYSLNNVTIENGVKNIDVDAFLACSSLTSIAIPDSVKSIEDGWSFNDCSSLMSIKVSEGNTVYSSVDGILFNKDKTKIVCYPAGKEGAYNIPSNVTSIGEHAFGGCESLTSITIPYGVISIGESAFSHCVGLKSIVIPNDITVIKSKTFYCCENLKSITIPNSITSIWYNAFNECVGLTDVYFTGIKEEWENINIDDTGNDNLKAATIHYNSTMPDLHEPCFLVSNSSITNTSDKKRRVSVIVAEYADNGGFIDAVINTVTFDAGETKSFDTPENTFKIFVWDSLSGIRPMTL